MIKKSLRVLCLMLVLAVCAQETFAAVTILKPGIIVDEITEKTQPLLHQLEREFKTVLGKRVSFDKARILSADWSKDKAENHYKRLIRSTDVNVIITLGILSSGMAVNHSTFPKPLIAVGIIDPELQHLKAPENNQSRIANLTYIRFNRNIKNDLEMFHKVYPYKKLAIIADSTIVSALVKDKKDLQYPDIAAKAGIDLVSVQSGINSALKAVEGHDAVYLLHLGRFEGDAKKMLIKALINMKLPLFSSSTEDIQAGALAAMSPPQSMQKIFRRVVLNCEALLDGRNLSELPVNITFDESLTINMDTARKINYSPPFYVLLQAARVQGRFKEHGQPLGLKTVVDQALKNNINLALSHSDTTLAKMDARLTRSQYFPTLAANATTTRIDEERAKASLGTAAEMTTSANAELTQILFSDKLNSSMTFSKQVHLSKIKRHGANRLDIVKQAATTYFTVLKAKTLATIQKDNLDLTRKHLSLARKRETAGFSGKADVYRWQSALESAKTQLFEASKDYHVSLMALNAIMNRPLNQPLSIEDESIDGPVFSRFRDENLFAWVSNPMGFDRFSDFLVAESKYNAPEIQEIDALISGYQRELTGLKRERYLPQAVLAGEALHVFDRSGQGSDVPGVDPSDDQWTVSVNLSWPLYSGGALKANAQKTSRQLKYLKQQKALISQSLEQNTRKALLNAANKVVNLEASRKSSEYAGKSLVLVQKSYALGKVAVSELVNAQNDAVNADLAYMNSVYDYLSAIFDLERAIGFFSLLAESEELDGFKHRLEAFMATNSTSRELDQ